MGAITFVLTGMVGAESSARQPVGRWVVGFAALGTLILWALVANSAAVNQTGARTDIATRIVESWIGERDYEIVSIEVDDGTARVVLAGAEFPEDAGTLGEELDHGRDGDPVDVDLRVNLQERILIEADGD